MKYCTKCGNAIADDCTYCTVCGTQQGTPAQNSQPYNQQPYNQQPYNQQPYGQQPYGQPYATPDGSSFGYALLGFCIPIVGLILFLIWKDTTPLRARSAGKGALISVILSFVFYVIYAVIIGAAIGGSYYYY